MERKTDKIDRKALSASRAAFWADKESNFASIGHAKPGKLEIAAGIAAGAISDRQAAWHGRYMAARQPLRLISGGKA